MIPADVQNSLKALALAQKPLITATSAVSATAAFEPGQKFQATVQAQLAPGIFKVQVADQLLQLQLPANIRSGDTITLQVVSLLPRLTFNMAASANPLSTADQLSATARLLSSLTQQPPEKGFIRPAGSEPLWTGATQSPDSTELAGKLHSALSQSGLFYESHQAQWIAGSRNTAQLMQEPQNLSAEKMRAAHGADPSSALANTAADNSSGKGNSILGIPEHLLSLVQQQLNALETRQVQWQGQVWINQQMDWHIREEDSHVANEDEGRHWMTQIHLNLPNLGEVIATLRFGNAGVSLALEAEKDTTRNKLGAASSQLVSTLSERGISITSALVKQHDNK
ncbi:MAG: flagellar hook-length control protein FliK [Gallionellaceae bacterium]